MAILDYLLSSYRIIWIFFVCCAFSPVVLLFLFFGMSSDWGHSYLRPVWSAFVLHGSFIRSHALGLEKINPREPCVFVVNHASEWDIFIFTHYISRHWRAVIKADLRSFPVVGAMAARLGQIFLNREGGTEDMIAQCAPHIRQGRAIVFFPEGKRTTDTALNEFRSGAFVLAERFNLPVLPVIIVEKNPVSKPGAFGRKFGHLPGKITLAVGEYLKAEPGKDTQSVIDALKQRAYRQMLALLDKANA